MDKSFYTTKEWLEKFGQQYQITNLRYLQHCCLEDIIPTRTGDYQCHLPSNWLAKKVGGTHSPWLLFAKGSLGERYLSTASEESFYTTKEWLAQCGQQYGIHNLRYLQAVLKQATPIDSNKSLYCCNTPKGWLALKLPGNRGAWLLTKAPITDEV